MTTMAWGSSRLTINAPTDKRSRLQQCKKWYNMKEKKRLQFPFPLLSLSNGAAAQKLGLYRDHDHIMVWNCEDWKQLTVRVIPAHYDVREVATRKRGHPNCTVARTKRYASCLLLWQSHHCKVQLWIVLPMTRGVKWTSSGMKLCQMGVKSQSFLLSTCQLHTHITLA